MSRRPPCHRILPAAALLLSTLTGCPGELEPFKEPPDLRTCKPVEGTTGSPSTIDEAVALINGLPKPTTIACFLESLDRPLRLNATTGVVSAQPAAGPDNPRVFLFSGASGKLVLSVVPAGDGSKLLEFGEYLGNARSIKGELPFPVMAPLQRDAPYTKVKWEQDPSVTTCSFCHRNEERVAAIDYADAYASVALRPLSSQAVTVDALRGEHEACDATTTPERCAILTGLFGWGDVLPGDFPAGLPTVVNAQ